MAKHTEQQISKYSTKQLFDLVVDVEKYPQFLLWCRAARILKRDANEFLAELVISFAHISESYTSRVIVVLPEIGRAGTIDVVMVKGPFEYLTNSWKFTEIEGGTQIDFTLDFKFRSRILEKIICSLYSKATAKMVTAFKARADTLYSVPAQ